MTTQRSMIRALVAGLQTVNPNGSDQAWVSDFHDEEHQLEWGTLAPVP